MFYISWVLGLLVFSVTGLLWYSKFLFGKNGSEKLKVLGVLMCFVTSGAINWLVLENHSSYLGAVQLALVVWVGFVGPFHANEVVYGKKPLSQFWIDSGYQVVGMLLVGLLSSHLVG